MTAITASPSQPSPQPSSQSIMVAINNNNPNPSLPFIDMVRRLPFITMVIFLILMAVQIAEYYYNDLTLHFGSSIVQTFRSRNWIRLITSSLFGASSTGLEISTMIHCFLVIERTMGSTIFFLLFIEIIVSINLLNMQLCWLLFTVTGDDDYNSKASIGMWPVYIAMYVMSSYNNYGWQSWQPILLLFPQLISSISTVNILGYLVGIAYGRFGYWGWFAKRVEAWEDEHKGWLRGVANMPSYVAIVYSMEYKKSMMMIQGDDLV